MSGHSIDVGPAGSPPPPPWALPGAVCDESSIDRAGRRISVWDRSIDPDGLVILSCTDTVISGRIMRSPTRIFCDPPIDSIDTATALLLARSLVDAVNLIEQANR